MKKEKENLRESKLTCNINLYKIKSAEMFAEFISNEEEEFYMICPKCGSEMPDDSAFCTRCGASLHTGTQENQNSQGGPQQGNPQGTPYGYGNPQGNNGAYYGNPQMNNGMPYGQPYVDPKDHSAEFDGKDIADPQTVCNASISSGNFGNHRGTSCGEGFSLCRISCA